MPLGSIWNCSQTKAADLSPLKYIAPQGIDCDFFPARDTNALARSKTLETINDKPAAEFWKDGRVA